MRRYFGFAFCMLSACASSTSSSTKAPVAPIAVATEEAPPVEPPRNIVVFPDLGFEVTLPADGWKYATDIARQDGLPIDLVIDQEERGVSIMVLSYWNTPEREYTLDHIAGFHQWRLNRAPRNKVGELEPRVDDLGYTFVFTACIPTERGIRIFDVMISRLHKVPEPVIVVYGVAPEGQATYLHKKMDALARTIAPYDGEGE